MNSFDHAMKLAEQLGEIIRDLRERVEQLEREVAYIKRADPDLALDPYDLTRGIGGGWR